MKTLATYFLKRWWGFYMGVFSINTFISLLPDGQSQIAQGCVSFFLVCLFADYLTKGGNGAFWIPLTRKQIGRIYWVFFLLVPTIILTGAETLGALLSDIVPFSVGAVLKHFVIFLGLVSAFVLSKKWPLLSTFFFILLLTRIHWEKSFDHLDVIIQIAAIPICLTFIFIAFVQAENFLTKNVPAAKAKSSRKRSIRRFFNFSKHPKRTGTAWIIELLFWPIIKIYIVTIALVFLFPFFDSLFLKILLIGAVGGSVISLGMLGFSYSNLRVTRVLPLTANRLALFMIGFPVAPIVFIGILALPIAVLMTNSFNYTLLIFLGILEVVLVVQTVFFFLAAKGVRGGAAAFSAVIIIVCLQMVFVQANLMTEFRLAISVLVTIPLAFFIHRHYLQTSSELYRPQKETPSAF